MRGKFMNVMDAKFLFEDAFERARFARVCADAADDALASCGGVPFAYNVPLRQRSVRYWDAGVSKADSALVVGKRRHHLVPSGRRRDGCRRRDCRRGYCRRNLRSTAPHDGQCQSYER